MASVIEKKLTLSLDEISKMSKKENKKPSVETVGNVKKTKPKPKVNKPLDGKINKRSGNITKRKPNGKTMVDKNKQNMKRKPGKANDMAAKTAAHLLKGQKQRQLAIQKKRKMVSSTNTKAKIKGTKAQNQQRKPLNATQKSKKQPMKVKPSNVRVTITSQPKKGNSVSKKPIKQVKLIQPTAGGVVQQKAKPKPKQNIMARKSESKPQNKNRNNYRSAPGLIKKANRQENASKRVKNNRTKAKASVINKRRKL